MAVLHCNMALLDGMALSLVPRPLAAWVRGYMALYLTDMALLYRIVHVTWLYILDSTAL